MNNNTIPNIMLNTNNNINIVRNNIANIASNTITKMNTNNSTSKNNRHNDKNSINNLCYNNNYKLALVHEELKLYHNVPGNSLCSIF